MPSDRTIHLTSGDILAEDAEALVNAVNCVGVMGRGIALAFKRAFPENLRAYAAACEHGEVRPGCMFVFETQQITNPRYIINFPTQRNCRDESRIGDIQDGLRIPARVIRQRKIRSIAVSALGCGLGGLEWRDVGPRIGMALCGLDNVDVVVFESGSAAEAENREASATCGSTEFGRRVCGDAVCQRSLRSR